MADRIPLAERVGLYRGDITQDTSTDYLQPLQDEADEIARVEQRLGAPIDIQAEERDAYASRWGVTRQLAAGVQDIGTAGNYVNLAWQTMMGTEQDQLGTLDSMDASQRKAQAMADPNAKTFSEAESVGDYVQLIANTLARSAPAMLATAPIGGGVGALAGKSIANHAIKGAASNLAKTMGAKRTAALGLGGRAAVDRAGGGITQAAARKIYTQNLNRITKRQLTKRGAQVGVGPVGFGFAQLPEQAGAIAGEEGRAQIEARMRTDRALFAQEGGDYSGTILKIDDGDSVWIRDATGQEHQIRMADNQAADKGQLGYETATNYLKQLLQPGQQVSFVNTGGKGKYQRELGHIYADGAQNSVNEDMLDAGVTAVHSAYATQNDYKRRVYENVQKGAELYGSRHDKAPLTIEDAYTSTKEYTGEDPKSLGEMLVVGLATSAAQGTLELAPWLHGLGRMSTRMRGMAATGDKLLARMGKTAAVEGVLSGTAEALTEGTQTILGQVFADYVVGEGYSMTQQDWAEVWDASATGFLVGTTMGGAGGLIRPVMQRKEFGEDTPEEERKKYLVYQGDLPEEGRTRALQQMQDFQRSLYNSTDAEVEGRWRQAGLEEDDIYLTPEQREEKRFIQQEVRDEAMWGQLKLRDDIRTYAKQDPSQLEGEEAVLKDVQDVLEKDIAEWENFPVEATANEILDKRHRVEEIKIKRSVLQNLRARVEAAQAGTEDLSKLGSAQGRIKTKEDTVDQKTQDLMDIFGESELETKQDDFDKRQEVTSPEVIAAQPLKNTITEYADITPKELSRSESGLTVWKSLKGLREEDPSNKEFGTKEQQANTLFAHQRDSRNAWVKGLEDLLAAEQRRLDATYTLSPTERAEEAAKRDVPIEDIELSRSRLSEVEQKEATEYIASVEKKLEYARGIADQYNARFEQKYGALIDEKGDLLQDEETLDIYLDQQMIEYESEEQAASRETLGAGVLTKEAMLDYVGGTRTDPVTGEQLSSKETDMGALADRMVKGAQVEKDATALEKLIKDNVGATDSGTLKKISNAWRALAGKITRAKGLTLQLVPYMGTNDKIQYIDFSEWSKKLGRNATKLHSGRDVKWDDRNQRVDTFLQQLGAVPAEDTAQVIKSLRILAAGTYTDKAKTAKGKEKSNQIYAYNSAGTKITLGQILSEVDGVVGSRTKEGSYKYTPNMPALEGQRVINEWQEFMPESFSGQEEGAALRPGERVQVKPRQVDERGFLKGNLENANEVWASPAVEKFLADNGPARTAYQEKNRVTQLGQQLGTVLNALSAKGTNIKEWEARTTAAANQVRSIKEQKTNLQNKINALPSLKEYQDAINNIKQRTRMALKSRNTEKVAQLAEQRRRLEAERDALLADASVEARVEIRRLDKKQEKNQKLLDTFAEVLELRKAQKNQEKIVADFGKKEVVSNEKEIKKLEESLDALRTTALQRETLLNQNYARARQTGEETTTTEQDVADLREIQAQIKTKEQRLKELQTPEKQDRGYVQGDIKAENSVESLEKEGKLRSVTQERTRVSDAFATVENKTDSADNVIKGFLSATYAALKNVTALKKAAKPFKDAKTALVSQQKKASALQKKLEAEKKEEKKAGVKLGEGKSLKTAEQLDKAEGAVKDLEAKLQQAESTYRVVQQQKWIKTSELPKDVAVGQVVSVFNKAGARSLTGARKPALYRVLSKTDKGVVVRALDRSEADIKERQKILVSQLVQLDELTTKLKARENPETAEARLKARRRRRAAKNIREAEGRDPTGEDVSEQRNPVTPGTGRMLKSTPKSKITPKPGVVPIPKDSLMDRVVPVPKKPLTNREQKFFGKKKKRTNDDFSEEVSKIASVQDALDFVLAHTKGMVHNAVVRDVVRLLPLDYRVDALSALLKDRRALLLHTKLGQAGYVSMIEDQLSEGATGLAYDWPVGQEGRIRGLVFDDTNPKMQDASYAAEVITHEIFHGVTSNAVALYNEKHVDEKGDLIPNSYGYSDLSRKALEALTKLDDLRLFVNDQRGYTEYETSDLDEFLTYGTTSPEFQKAMNEIQDPQSKKSVWNRFIELMAGLLGFSLKRGSVLESLLGHSGDLIDAIKRDGPYDASAIGAYQKHNGGKKKTSKKKTSKKKTSKKKTSKKKTSKKKTSKKKRKPTPTPYTVEELSKDTYLEAEKEIGPHLPKDVKAKIKKILNVVSKTTDASPEGAALISTLLSANDSAGRMRGFRVAYHTIMSHDDKALLHRALNTKLVQRQVKLTMSRETWEALRKEDPDVYLATVFDLWRADLLRLGPKTDTILGRIVKLARDVVGWVTRADQSGQLMNAMLKTSEGLSEKMSNIERKLYQDPQLQDNKFQTYFSYARNTGKLMNNLLQRAEPPRDALRRLHIPAVDKIIDLFSSTMGVQSDVDYDAAVSQQKGIWHARMLEILGGKDQAFVESYGHFMRTGIMPKHNAEMKKAVTETRKLMKHLYTYLSEAGVQMDEVKTPYFPRVWDPDYIALHRTEYRTDLMKHMEGENGQMTKEEAEIIIDHILDNEGVADPHLITEFSPTMSSTKKRGLMYKLAGSTPEKRGSGKGLSKAQEKQREIQAKIFDKYKDKDSLSTLSTYVHSAIKKAEYSRRFGVRGEKLTALLAQASKEGLSSENNTKLTLFIESQLGIPRANINPKVKNAQGWALVGLSMAILPGILLSSGPDVLGPYHRSRGDWQTKKAAYGTMIGELIGKLKRESKDDLRIMHETFGTVENRAFSDLLLERTHGTFMSGAQRKTANEFFEFVKISPYTRWVRSGATAAAVQFIAGNKGNAKYMGELGLKEQDITLNSDGSLKYMTQVEYFETLDKISKEMAEINTLRLKEEDILTEAKKKEKGITEAQKKQIDAAKKKIKALEKKIAPEKKLLETDAKIKGAINRWVNAASMRPNPAVRPAYMNDPRFMLFSYLKDFIYSSYDVIGKQMYYLITEPRDNVFKGDAPVSWKHSSPEARTMAKAMLMMGPMYFMGEMIRDLIQHGDDDDPAKRGWTAVDHGWNSIKRAGIFGPGEFGFDALEAEERGNFIGRDYMGPVYGKAADLVGALSSNDEGAMTRYMKRLLPGQALWKYWTED